MEHNINAWSELMERHALSVSIGDYHVAINADHVAIDACHVVINAGQTHHIFSAQASRSGTNSIRVSSRRPNCSDANLLDTQSKS